MRVSEFKQELELMLRGLEQELEAEDEPKWNTRSLIEYQTSASGVFFARISGFDLHSATSPDKDVMALHNSAADRIAREIVARTDDPMVMRQLKQCVFFRLRGFADPGSESGTRDGALGSKRAQDVKARVVARLNMLADIPPGMICVKIEDAGIATPLFPSSNATGRHLNRRVVVSVERGDCPRGCR